MVVNNKLNICKLWNEHCQCYLHRHGKVTCPNTIVTLLRPWFSVYRYLHCKLCWETLVEGIELVSFCRNCGAASMGSIYKKILSTGLIM